METLIVFSHLRWNFVYQRPQHLLSRMAKRWRVVFIEEPMPGAAENRLEQLEPAPGVQVWRPHVSGEHYGFHDDHLPVLRKMVAEAMAAQQLRDYWVWFYTPMAYPLAADLSPRGIVYDCMDELTAFRNAPRQLVQRENALFSAADLVFTGGRSLYNAKKNRHPDVHCFPSSVDAKHFSETRADHPLQAGIARPRLGYCGVIDERVDLSIIDTLAQARPEWQIVMVGPVVKIDPASLPQRPNIHWLGQQSYDDLPSFISGWDVCMLPFALNEATRYISPTKTLEYMACGRPSVSTPIKDVVEPYGHLVSIAADPAQFLAACDVILGRVADEQVLHAQALGELVATTSWDRVAHSMGELIASADLDRTRSTAANAPSRGGVVAPAAELANASARVGEPAVPLAARRAVAG